MIETWIMETLSKRSPTFGGLPPCPFARRAWLEGKVVVDEVPDWSKTEVHITTFDPDTITPEELTEMALLLCDSEFVALEDHPHEPEIVGDVCMNYGEKALLLVQKRKELDEARRKLPPSYYENMPLDFHLELLSR